MVETKITHWGSNNGFLYEYSTNNFNFFSIRFLFPKLVVFHKTSRFGRKIVKKFLKNNRPIGYLKNSLVYSTLKSRNSRRIRSLWHLSLSTKFMQLAFGVVEISSFINFLSWSKLSKNDTGLLSFRFYKIFQISKPILYNDEFLTKFINFF